MERAGIVGLLMRGVSIVRLLIRACDSCLVLVVSTSTALEDFSSRGGDGRQSMEADIF